MKLGFKIAACTLPLALMLTGCESAHDVARKPDVIAKLLDAADDCPTLAQYGGIAAHNVRLGKVLREVDTADLDAISNHGTKICLDKGFYSNQNTKFTHSRLVGSYSSTTNTARLFDDGDDMDAFFGSRTVSYDRPAVERLGARFAEGNMGDATAGRVNCGKSCTTSRWGDIGTRFSGAEANNPALIRPAGP